MHRSANLLVGAVVGGRFEVLAGPPGPDVPVLRSTHARALRARDRTTGEEVLLEATTVVVPADFPVAPRGWPAAPGLVAIHASGHDAASGAAYLAREAAKGVALGARATLGDARAVEVALGVLAALEALHARQVVDGRLSPERVVLAPGGAVRLLPPSTWSGYPGFSAPGPARTDEVPAPESLAGGSGLTPAADVYAVAALLYRLLAGRAHVSARTTLQLFMRLREPPDPLAAARPDLPAALGAVVMRGLAPDPAARWATATELAQALRRVRDATAP